MATSKKNIPHETLRDGFLKVTIWKNQGDKGVYFTASPAKTYEKDGELSDCNSYSDMEILRMAELNRQAYKRMRELRSELTEDNKSSPAP